MKLTTFKTLEESIIEDQGTALDTSKFSNDGDAKKTSPSKTIDSTVLETQDNLLTAVTEPTVLVDTVK